jgi:hypothetical protein
MRLRAIALLLLLPSCLVLQARAALAADAPEAVYAKFHRAAMAGDLEEMLKHGPAQRRTEIRSMSPASKDAALKMAQFMMPRAFTVERTIMASNGRATLIVSGPGDGGGGKLQPIYGTVRMLTENGEWKVDEASWSTDKPAILTAAPPAAPKGPAPVLAPGGSAYTELPARKLGEAKQECVYKPVMTAKDIEACK